MTIYLVIASARGYEESYHQEVAAYTNEVAANAHAFAANKIAEECQQKLDAAREAWEGAVGGSYSPEGSVAFDAFYEVQDSYCNPYDAGAKVVEISEVPTYHVKPMEIHETFTP